MLLVVIFLQLSFLCGDRFLIIHFCKNLTFLHYCIYVTFAFQEVATALTVSVEIFYN